MNEPYPDCEAHVVHEDWMGGSSPPMVRRFAAEWARCKPWIEAALPYCYGTHTIEDVERQIESGLLQFWPGERCAVVTEVVVYPRLKALNFFLVGGDLSELLEKMEPAIVEWAKGQGCTRVAQTGRKGWGRVLAPLGYETTLSVMLKGI